MQFTDGLWKTKQCYNIKYLEQAYDIRYDETGITVYATHCTIQNRGQTLGGPLITAKYTPVNDDIIKVTLMHYDTDNKSYFETNEIKNYKPVFNDTENYLEMKVNDLSIKINKIGSFCTSFYNKNKKITESGSRNAAYILENKTSVMLKNILNQDEGFWSIPHLNSNSYIREQLQIGVGENIYGLGETFTPLIKNGQSIDIWNSDGGTSSKQSYKSIPFYISNKGYGVFVNHSENVSFEVCTENVSAVQFSVEGEKLEYYIIGGKNIKEVIKNYTYLTGKPSLPPAWTFGLWLTTSFTTSYDEKTVNSFIDGMKERDIPLEVFHFDCFWMKEFNWCNFKWDISQFEDPQTMLKRLKQKELKLCVWINPYIAQRSELFEEGKQNGYFIKTKTGNVFQCDEWQPGMAIVDFTNPNACKWYSSKLENLIDMGIDCFKTDFGERIPTDVVYYNNAEPIKMHNYYTYLYNKTVFDLLKSKLGENKAALFARSATAGSQKFPVHWGGDCSAKYSSMAETLRGGLSLCLSGFGFWSHDISGFEATATPDIYKRWTAFGLLSSHSRLHGNSSYRVPWLFDEEAVDVLRFFTKLKGSLMPYIFSQAIKTHKAGIPMLRAMFIEFDEPACNFLDTQYMLGDNLLVAPIFSDTGEVTYYLPQGIWTNIITKEVVEGGKYITQKFDYFSLPLMAKQNTLLPFGNFENHFEYDYLNNLTVYAYNVIGKAKCIIYDKDYKEFVTIEVLKNNSNLEIKLNKPILNSKLIIEDRQIDISNQTKIKI